MSDTQDFRERFGPQSSFCAAAAYRAIVELEAEVKALYERRLPYREAEVAQARYEEAEAEVAEYKSAVKSHLASHHHGGYNAHTALTALAERATP